MTFIDNMIISLFTIITIDNIGIYRVTDRATFNFKCIVIHLTFIVCNTLSNITTIASIVIEMYI